MSNNDKDSDKSKAMAQQMRENLSVEEHKKRLAIINEAKLKILRQKAVQSGLNKGNQGTTR